MHWQTENERDFFPRYESRKIDLLPPSVYRIARRLNDTYFSKTEHDSDLVRFENTIVDEIVEEIDKFWGKEDLFRRHNFPFRRGILFHGPQGSGKSCAVKMILQDVVKLGGIGIICDDYTVFNAGMTLLRDIQPNTPVVVVMEDLDSLVEYDESEILNMLDGICGYDKVVFLATTNYLEKLAGRVKDRPSRFDRCIKIDQPTEQIRLAFLKHLIGKSGEFDHLDIVGWARDSDGLSMAHLKELFISIAFFDADYKDVIVRLRNMGQDTNKTVPKDVQEIREARTNSDNLLKYLEKGLDDYDEDDEDDDPPDSE